MIPRVERRGISPTTRTAQARRARAGTRTAGIGERNIHHTDCINVTMHRKRPGADRHTSLNTHTGTAACGTGADGTTAPGLPAGTAWLSHTIKYLFFALCKTSEKRERHLSLYQNEKFVK